MSEILVNDAKAMSKGQVTIPKDIRAALGVTTGDRVTFIVENVSVRVINSAIYAMQKFQRQMAGEGAKVDLDTDEAIAEWITQSRREENLEIINSRTSSEKIVAGKDSGAMSDDGDEAGL